MGTTSKTINSTPFWVGLFSTLGAVGVHFYLKQVHYAHKYGFGMENSICDISDKFSCAVASASTYSEIFGVPLALLGAIVNGLLIAFLLGYKFSLFPDKAEEAMPTIIKGLSLLIFATSIVMAAVSFLMVKSLCPFCVAAYVLSGVTLISVFMALPGPLQFSATVMTWIPAALAATFVISLGWHTTNLVPYGGKELAKMTQLRIEDWQSKSSSPIQTVSPLTYGDQASPMKIVEFADFLCSHCRTAFPKLHTFVQSHANVTLEFQSYPLDGNCNEGLPASPDGARCYLARLSHCGGEQDKGWAMQEWMFENQASLTTSSRIKDKLPEAIEGFEIDSKALESCVESEATFEIIKQQAALGKKLGIKGTPAIFVNGKEVVGGADLSILQALHSIIETGN